MNVKKASYVIRKADGVLREVVFGNVEEDAASKIEALAKKNGFDDSHILAKRNSWIVSDGAEGLFRLIYDDGKKSFSFRHYGKPSSDAPDLSALFDINFIKARFAQNYAEIKSFEEGRSSTFIDEEKVGGEGKHKEEVKFILFMVNANGLLPNYFMGYWFEWDEEAPADKLGKCKAFAYFLSNPSCFYYRDDIWKEIIFRPEFLDLCTKKGYKWVCKEGEAYPYDHFKNDAAGIKFDSLRKGFDEIYSGAECSAMFFFPIKGSKASESEAPGVDSGYSSASASMRDR